MSGIPGLDQVAYLTSDEALRLPEQPKRMAVVGGGYIAAELAHFFGALGTEITLIHRRSTMLREEDPEIAGRFTQVYQRRFNLLLATGRVPNTDLLAVSNAAVETDDRGYLKTDPYLETNVPGIWALGDIVGRYLLKHSANLEASYAANNISHPGHKEGLTTTPCPTLSLPRPRSPAWD